MPSLDASLDACKLSDTQRLISKEELFALLSAGPTEGRAPFSEGRQSFRTDRAAGASPATPPKTGATARELRSVASISDILPSEQLRLVKLIQNSPDEIIFEKDPAADDVIVTITNLVPVSAKRHYDPSVVFQNLVEDLTRVRIARSMLPADFLFADRTSASLARWRAEKLETASRTVERIQGQAIRTLLATRRTLAWTNKTIDAVFRARYAALEKEAANAQDAVFAPISFNAFLDNYAKMSFGNVHRVSMFAIELVDAVIRYFHVSAHARMLAAFWTYCHSLLPDELRGAVRLSYRNQCLAFILSVRATASGVCIDRRVTLPSRTILAAHTFVKADTFRGNIWHPNSVEPSIPRYFDAKVVQFPTHKAFITNAVTNLTKEFPGRFACIMKSLERSNIWMPAKTSAGRLTCDCVESELYGLLECLLHIFEEILIDINGPDETLLFEQADEETDQLPAEADNMEPYDGVKQKFVSVPTESPQDKSVYAEFVKLLDSMN